MKNILITTLGTSWSIIPELIGFTNPGNYNLYRNHPDIDKINRQQKEHDIRPVDEVWVATTNGRQVKDNLEPLKRWQEKTTRLPVIRLFSYSDLKELNTVDEIRPMADLIYRVVLHARDKAGEGKVYISIAGGRKNMSANIQNAAYIFGCDTILHVLADEGSKIHSDFNTIDGFTTIPGDKVKCFYPVVINGKTDASPFLFVEPEIVSSNFPLKETLRQKNQTDLFEEISQRQQQSANSLLNIYKKRSQTGLQTNYTVFHLLKPGIVNRLQTEKIGVNSIQKEEEIKWLRKIPKAELHCHFGGILSPSEMIEVAFELKKEVEDKRKSHPGFNQYLLDIEKTLDKKNTDFLSGYAPKIFRNKWREKGIEEPLAIAGLLQAFEHKAELLKEYIYGCVKNFKGIGIEQFEQLGDLQGSSLLQSEKTIRKTCRILKRQCQNENIRYIEVRCSPENYTRSGLTGKKVVEILTEELQDKHTVFKLIFIASRHTDNKFIKKHIDLALGMRQQNKLFKKMFVGFDLAGVEKSQQPAELRNDFMDILEQSIPTTIHAGEDMPAGNIWEAIYHLSAERIGHGLTLNENPGLKQRIKERKIAIELCPSSNDQIVGYLDYCNPDNKKPEKLYPLKQYLKEGLKVTINTDDPGISLSNLTCEYYKAACMTEGGLSKWELLQINRNGFKYGFLSLEEKKKLLSEVEEELFKLVTNE